MLFQKRLAMPVGRKMASQTLLETIGRKSGLPRQTPIGGRLIGSQFWFVSEHGAYSQYIRNIKANSTVRVRYRGRWLNGVAHLLPGDDAKRRLNSLPRANSAGVRALGTSLLTVRVDLH